MDFSMWLSSEETTLHKSQEEDEEDNITHHHPLRQLRIKNKSDFVLDFVLQRFLIHSTVYKTSKKREEYISKGKEGNDLYSP